MKSPDISIKQDRIVYLDYLRIWATMLVILLHLASQKWDTVAVGSYERNVFLIFKNISGGCVNLFMAISGALFLDNDRKLSLKKLFRVNIFRIITAFLFWSALYAFDMLISGATPMAAAQNFLQGNFHMWFLVMIVAYYLLTPVLRKITASQQMTAYCLILIFLAAILIPSLLECLSYFSSPGTDFVKSIVSYLRTVSNFGFCNIFLFYYLWGFYLCKFDIPKIARSVLPLASVAGPLFRILVSLAYCHRTGSDAVPFTFFLCDFGTVTGLIVLAKYTLPKVPFLSKPAKSVSILSKFSFGVYLSHIFIMNKLDLLGVNVLSFNPVFSVPVLLLVVLMIGYVISAILHTIPVLNKYIV